MCREWYVHIFLTTPWELQMEQPYGIFNSFILVLRKNYYFELDNDRPHVLHRTKRPNVSLQQHNVRYSMTYSWVYTFHICHKTASVILTVIKPLPSYSEISITNWS